MNKNGLFIIGALIILVLGCACSKNVENTARSTSESAEAASTDNVEVVSSNGDDKSKQKHTTTIYPEEYLGLWHGYGTDSTKSLAEIELTAINEKEIYVNEAKFTFISKYVAEAPSDQYMYNVRLTKRLELGVDSKGNQAIVLYNVNKKNGTQCSEAMCCYRETEKSNFQDFIIGITEPLCNYIGKTFGDVKESFGYGYLFKGYEGVSILPYLNVGITFFMDKYIERPTIYEIVASVSSNTENAEIIEGLNGSMTYDNILSKVGKENMSKPVEYYSEMDNCKVAHLKFDYKGYEVEYEWLGTDYTSAPSTYAYCTTKNKQISSASSSNKFLTVDEAKEKLRKYLTETQGGLGTWVEGEENIITSDGEKYNEKGNICYRMLLRGRVDNHYTTLTAYYVPLDGSDIFEQD